MKTLIQTLLAASILAGAAQAGAQVVFYEHPDFQGLSLTTSKPLDNLSRSGFNDRASSAIVLHDRWEVCNDNYYGGRCVVLREGRYPSLIAMGLDDSISSAREVHREARLDESRYAPVAPQPVYDSRRRGGERLYKASVTSVRAVVGAPTQRCWMEREEVKNDSGPSVGGALAGALIGGVLGHQVGNGTGRDIATVGGAVVGGAIGSKVARDNNPSTQEVQRCETVASNAKPEFWDVTYDFRGQEHRMQVAKPPGKTITVNAQGEPRA